MAGVNLVVVMGLVDFYLETKQERLPTPHPHLMLPPVLPVWPAVASGGPEVPSVFLELWPCQVPAPFLVGRDRQRGDLVPRASVLSRTAALPSQRRPSLVPCLRSRSPLARSCPLRLSADSRLPEPAKTFPHVTRASL